MGNLVFQATLGGQVNLVGPNTASTYNLNVPTVNSTLATLAAQTFAGTQTISSGNLVFSGTSQFVTGDFSNATVASRLAFQSSTSNGSTGIYAMPNGTSTAASWQATNAADPTNASKVLIATNGSTDVQLVSGRNGTGTYLPLTFYTNGSEQMRLDTSGNAGIGVTPSAWISTFKALQAGNGASFQGQTNSVSVAHFSGNAYVDSGGTYRYIGTGEAAQRYQQYQGAHSWYTAASGTAGNAITFTQAMTLDASGNLLVGTTTALNSLAKINAYNTTGGNGGIAVGYGSSAGQYRVMYLISSNGGLYFDNASNAAYLNSAGAWTNASDARLKNSITDIKYGLSAVLSSQPRSYKMNDLEGDYIGFVAQELQTVIPEVVSGDPEKQLGVDYGSLVAVAFKAIQEQQAIIETLTSRIAALENK